MLVHFLSWKLFWCMQVDLFCTLFQTEIIGEESLALATKKIPISAE